MYEEIPNDPVKRVVYLKMLHRIKRQIERSSGEKLFWHIEAQVHLQPTTLFTNVDIVISDVYNIAVWCVDVQRTMRYS